VPHHPEQVIPEPLARAIGGLPIWFVIGGHAVRCFRPYRPSRDVDFGVAGARDLGKLLRELGDKGRVEILERSDDTVHLRFDGIDVSIFVLEKLARFSEDRRLTVTGILATKLHAILDRGTRRDFFDLYVTLQVHQLGIAECLAAMREVYGADLRESLLLRSLTYFDDADREGALPGEGHDDWATVKGFFFMRVGNLLVPPSRVLIIQDRVVDLRASPRPEGASRPARARSSPPRGRPRRRKG
jgi:hypothetical protein